MRRLRHSRGFTLLEVMMALTVLAIGMLGVVALQATTVGATQDAQQFAVANAVARTWVQRLQRDAQRWNHPSALNTASDLGDTSWLSLATSAANVWVRPMASARDPFASPAFDRNGDDVLLTDVSGMRDRAVYCTHIRMRQVYPDMIKAEVRVFWRKRRLANPTKFAAHGLGAGICSTTGSEALLGQDGENFHWTYAVAGVQKSRAQ